MKNAAHSRPIQLSTKLVFAVLAAYLCLFFILPIGRLIIAAFADEGIVALPAPWRLFFDNPLYIQSLINSILVSSAAAVLAALFALPVAMLLWRFRIQPPLTLELFGFLPLFIPPFMLSLSLQSLLGRGSALGQLLAGWSNLDPALWGLPSVAVVEAIHYFPLVLTTLIMTTTAYAQQAHEAARLGSGWPRLLAKVFIPLGLPGLGFGMAITFLKTLDDLATPLSLGITNLLAPQTFYRVSTYGAQDPLSSLMAVSLVVISALVWLVSVVHARRGQPGWHMPEGGQPALSRQQWKIGMICLLSISGFYLLCYSGMILSSIARIWSYTPLPESYVLTHYLTAFKDESGSFMNTLIYCGFAAFIDVIVGLTMAYAIDRAPSRWKSFLTWGSVGLLSVPGIALAIAYLQFFQGMHLPFADKPLDTTWFLLPMAFSIRGLPFAIRASTFTLQNVPASYVEAANLSGSGPARIITRIVLPMMGFGLLIAFLLCFGISAVDLSSAMLLVPSETDAPVSYSIYLRMQSTTGRGVGSALALLTIVVIALAMMAMIWLIRRRRNSPPNLRRIVFPGGKNQ